MPPWIRMLGGDVIEGVRAVCLGDGGSQREIIGAGFGCATGVVRGGPGGSEFHQHVREFVFDGLERADRPPGIVHGPWRSRRSFPALGGGADLFGGQPCGPRSSTASM